MSIRIQSICLSIALGCLLKAIGAPAVSAQPQSLDISTPQGREKYNDAVKLHNEGVILFQKQDYAGAMEKFKAAIDAAPDFAEAHCNYGNSLMNSGRYQEALAEFQKATKIKPDLSVTWEDLGTCYQTLGRTPEAVTAYKRFLAISPNQGHYQKIKSTVALLENEIKRTSASPVTNGANDYIGDATQNGMTRWSSAAMPLKIYIKTGESVPDYRPKFAEILKEAFTTWSDASKGLVTFVFVDNESGANILCSWTNNPKEMMSSAEGGHAMVIPDEKGITKAVLILLTVNPVGGIVTDNYAKRVDLHEIGHALGVLGHSKNPDDIMFSSLPPADLECALSERDKNTLVALYSADTGRPLDISRLLMSGDPSSTVVRIVKLNAEASEAMKSKNFVVAVAKLEEAHRLDPANELVNGNLGAAYGNAATLACMTRNFPQADKYFNQALPLLEKSSNKANYITILKNYDSMLRSTQRFADAEKVSKHIKELEASTQ